MPLPPRRFWIMRLNRPLPPLLPGRSPDELLPLRIIDPACGAGRALIAAYRYLLKFHGGKRLTFAERADLLRYTIHGLDLDPHAVAATRMLLALAACEGEDAGTPPDGFFAVFRDLIRILSGTIRCGNALIGPEIADDESWAFCPARERHALRSFDWQEHFGEILVPGGFDVVICCPPERPVPAREWLQQYFQRHFAVYDAGVSSSAFFIEKGLVTHAAPGGARLRDRGPVAPRKVRRTVAGTAAHPADRRDRDCPVVLMTAPVFSGSQILRPCIRLSCGLRGYP